MYAIAGVSGHVGSVVARTLLEQRKPVRVIVRDAAKGDAWKAKGAEVAVAALDDEAAMTKALTGVTGAFLLLPPDVATKTPLEDNARRTGVLTRAAKAAKLSHLVLLSSIGAHQPDGTGPIRALHRAEAELTGSGAALTFVRAASFHENWGMALGALGQGMLPTFIPAGLAYPQVASKDIAKVVAAALVEGPTRGAPQIIELSGPRDYSANDAAAALSTITGKPVKTQDAPLDAVVPTITSFGVSAPVAELFREMYAGVASGRVAQAPATGSVRHVRGTTELAETLRGLLG